MEPTGSPQKNPGLTAAFLSDNINDAQLRWARSATRHRVSRLRSRFVIDHAGVVFIQPAAPPDRPDPRLVWLGDDADGEALEVMAALTREGDVLVLHSMPLRDEFRPMYEEATRWQR